MGNWKEIMIEMNYGVFQHKTKNQLQYAFTNHWDFNNGKIELNEHTKRVRHAKVQFRSVLEGLLSNQYNLSKLLISHPEKKNRSVQVFLIEMGVIYRDSDFDWMDKVKLNEFSKAYKNF